MPYAMFVSYDGQGSARKWEPTGIIYADGVLAGGYAKEENAFAARRGINRRYKAVKISDDDPLLWREREQRKLEDGTYQLVPWHGHYYTNTGMFEHIDPDDATKVRFIANDEDGYANKYTRMNPGRFVKRYIDCEPEPRLLDKWCAQMGMEETTSELKIARTADEIYHVYTSGPHSCMAYEKNHGAFNYIRGIHPTEVYGDSDIGVAYIERYGEITARCTVWPDKKIHGRIYGDRARLLERLKENGYVEDWQGFAGAKIRQLWTHNGYLVLPYIDGDLGVILEEDKWLILSEKPHILAHSPYGIPEATECERCGAMDVPLTRYKEDEDQETSEYICADGCKSEPKPEPEPTPMVTGSYNYGPELIRPYSWTRNIYPIYNFEGNVE